MSKRHQFRHTSRSARRRDGRDLVVIDGAFKEEGGLASGLCLRMKDTGRGRGSTKKAKMKDRGGK